MSRLDVSAQGRRIGPGRRGLALAMANKPIPPQVVARTLDQAQRLRAQGRASDAWRLLHPIVADGYGSAGACALAGRLCLELGRHERAVELLDRARALVPKDEGIAFSHAIALKRAGRIEDAMASCERMIERDPASVHAATLMADSLSDLRRDDEARAELDRVEGELPEAQRTTEQHVRLLIMRAMVGGIEARALADAVEAVIAGEPAPALRSAVAQAATITAKTLDREAPEGESGGADRERVVALLERAKALRPMRFDPDAHDRRIDHALDSWRERGVSVPSASGVDGSGLVVIVGMPRSGTSILEQMLACHPGVTPRGERGELGDVARMVERPTEPNAVPIVTDPSLITQQQVDQLGAEYVRRLVGDAPGCVTTKMPYDFLSVPLLARLAPGARVIHTRRGALDTCWSGYMQWFNRAHLHTGSQEWMARFWLAYDRLIRGYAELDEPVRPPMYELDYEDLAREPEGVMRPLLEWLGLAWDDAVLHPERSGRVVLTASRDQVRSPINTRSIGRAEAYGDLLGPMRRTLGLG